jgi:dTDP-glucose 4,6-dehydratase
VQSYIRTHKLPMLIVRGSNNYGPYQFPEKLIPLTVTNMLEDKRIPIHGDGGQVRRWIHVEDFCRAIDLIMHKGKDFSIYNVAGVEYSNLKIINSIACTLNKNPKDFIFFIKDRPGGDRRYAPNATKIKKELGWKLEYPIDRYLPIVVQWYLDNPRWWKKIKKTKDFKDYYFKRQLRSEY